MAPSCDGLVTSSPGGPRQCLFGVGQARPDDGPEETSHFRTGEGNQLLLFTQSDQAKLAFAGVTDCLFFEVAPWSATRITVNNARAAIDSVT